MKIFDGKKLADKIAEQLSFEIANSTKTPTLAIVTISPDARSASYIAAKQTRAAAIGATIELVELSNPSQAEATETIKRLASNELVDGIILQLPIPSSLDTEKLLDLIPINKDVDGISSKNLELLKTGDEYFVPATPLAILEILKAENIELDGKKVVLIGKGKVVGRPLQIILERHKLDVTCVDSDTKNLENITKKADIVISAVGKPKFLTGKYFAKGVMIIDAGMSTEASGISGDIDFDAVKEIASFITPTKGGVGPVTVACLLKNLVYAASQS